MSLEPGTHLGIFEILGPIGAGGMGEVYRARDTRLGREVAIKVLPETFARDPMRVSRFEREARLLASINHPAIAAIYGAEESGDARYIVMELVPGDTLAERMARGALSLEESLSFARQIAEGLEAAHEKGVVHRDLKPSNIKVTPEGKIKVLDLGLAKAMEPPVSGEDLSGSPTVALEQTRPGTILGTVEFMSPEQARGKEVDKRTDIWAFGCVLFEMLSGRRAFSGQSLSDVLVAILSREPDWSALPAETPARVRELLSRCLEKDLNQRLRDIGDARIELERAPKGPDQEAAPLWRGWAIVAVLVLALAGGLVWLIQRQHFGPPGAVRSDKSLVVLPAKVISDFPGGQLLGDGLVETLSLRLNEVPGIQVVTPTAAVAASDKNADPFGAARSVGANLVVQPSVMHSGDRVRIVYLVWNVQSGAQVAGGTVESSASDLFGMQDQLAERVATQLKLPGPAKKASTPIGLETASQQERYLQALGLLQRYDKPASVDAATRALQTLWSERPESALIAAALGRAYLYKFNLTREKTWADQASEAIARSQSLAPDLPEVEATRGELLVQTGKSQEAIAAFRRALSLQPNSYDALLGLARAYDTSGDSKNAEAAYRRAVALQPTYWAGYSKLGGFYFNHGSYRSAAEMFLRVTTLAPDNARAFANLGASYALTGDFPGALAAFQKSLAIERTSLAYSNIGTVQFFLGNYKESAKAFESATTLTPAHYEFWVNLGDAYRWSGKSNGKAQEAYEKAISLCSEELRVNSRNAHVRSYLALALAKTGRISEAEEESRRALAIDATNPEFLFNAGVVANLARRSPEALDRLRRAVEAGYSTAIVAHDPELANLRDDRQLQELLKPRPPKL